MALTSLFPAQGLQNFIDETANVLVASATMSAGTLGGSGVFRSSIVGRAPITDISQNLKPAIGIERIMTQLPYLIQNEFGPLGESVYGVLNDDRGLIRIVGSSVQFGPDIDGNYIQASQSGTTTDFVEITFYGTGLNLVSFVNAGARDFRATVDGGTEGGNLYPSGASNILQQRNYAMNTILPVTSGLALGIHTVKIRNNGGNGWRLCGIEILNESTSLKTASGSAYVSGRKITLSALDSQSPTSSFTNTFGVAGSKGGRVLVYLDQTGSVKKDIQYVDTANAMGFSGTINGVTYTGGAVDHSNEELVRVYHWREFGAGRSDDFSSLTTGGGASSRALTLDDGTTTLVASAVLKAVQTTVADALQMTATNAFVTLTFVGTGIDMESYGDVSAAGDAHAFILDGVTISTLSTTTVANTRFFTKIASGLPYGTHTLKINRNAAASGSAYNITKFFVYQPKKPALPAGAVELADYNVMATYVANTNAGVFNLGTGVLRKMASREFVFVDGSGGTQNWVLAGLDVTNSISTILPNTDRTANFQHTFFGTGLEIRSNAQSNRSSNISVTLNGFAATTTNFPALTSSSYGGWSFNASTGILSQNTGSTTPGAGTSISGLPLGKYTIVLTNNSAGNVFTIDSLDIITPIHSAKSSIYADIENTLPVGSCALSDNRQNQPLKSQVAQKAWVQAVGISSSPTLSTTGVYVPAPDMSVTIKVANNCILEIFYAICSANNSAGNGQNFQMYLDGVVVPSSAMTGNDGAGFYNTVTDKRLIPVSAGVHKIDIFWLSGSGTNTMLGTNRVLSAREL